jgi:hypothetical protein
VTAVATCRFADRCTLDSYEAAIECVASHSEKTRTEIASEIQALTGKSAGYLRSCLSPNDDSHVLQLSIAPAVTKASGNPALLLWLARACGYGIYRQPAQTASRTELLAAFLDTNVAHGELARAVRAAQADRKLSPAERIDITQRAQQTIAELVELIAAVNLEADPPQ